jgi:hypothetical protein
MYTTTNFKTKKQLEEAVAVRLAYLSVQRSRWIDGPLTVDTMLGSRVRTARAVTVFQPNDMVGNHAASSEYTGRATIEGPHYPEPHRWYASVEIVKGEVVKVK